jgi:transcriptional regulator with XRE-family HTH domain
MRDTTFAMRLRELRERRGLTQAELAQKSGLTQATVSRLEEGGQARGRVPKLPTLLALAAALGVGLARLAGSPSSRIED